MNALPHRILIAVLVLLPGVTSCGDDPAIEPTSDPPSAAALVVTPETVLFTALGDTLRLAAEVRDQQGRPMSGAAVAWTSSDASVAVVAQSGVVRAVAPGVATITDVQAVGLDSIIGFHHGGASADIDADGDLDVFVTDNFTRPFFLVNDGTGNFVPDAARIEGIGSEGIFTAELVDVDRDGYVDVLAAGHEYEGFPTQILWGDNTGVFSTMRALILPAIPGHGIVVDIDVADTDGDGDRDIVLNRTGDDSGPGWYDGYYMQLLEQTGTRTFSDITQHLLPENQNAEAAWITWLRVFDLDEDGDLDIFADEASRRRPRLSASTTRL